MNDLSASFLASLELVLNHDQLVGSHVVLEALRDDIEGILCAVCDVNLGFVELEPLLDRDAGEDVIVDEQDIVVAHVTLFEKG